MFLMPKNSTLIKTLLVLLIMLSLLITAFIIIPFYPSPSQREDEYHIARYLQKHASSETLTLFDSPDLDDHQYFVWYLVTFWSKSRLMLYPLNNSDICHSSIKEDYLISNKTLSYQNLTSDGGYNLYRINCS
jgi:hypothetical protein